MIGCFVSDEVNFAILELEPIFPDRRFVLMQMLIVLLMLDYLIVILFSQFFALASFFPFSHFDVHDFYAVVDGRILSSQWMFSFVG